jgi:diguanylate cyclase (GGDEF)-like protein
MNKILIVDDEAATREALMRTLRGDFEILQADGPKQALEILRKTKDVAIIIADQVMEEGLGTDLLIQVKDTYPQIVRVIISGQIDLAAMMVAVNKAHVHRFIMKPWENDLLRVNLLEALQQHRDLSQMLHNEKLAITDPVTQIHNHRYFQERFREEFRRAERHGRPLSLIMIDVDHFKAFNDKFGHPEGDRALQEIAQSLKVATRDIDTVCRYGGEEFALILPETEPTVGIEVAERIRSRLENTPVGGNKKTPHVITLSIGVAGFPENGKTPEDIIDAADQALYAAKREGRNRVVRK